MDIVVIIWQVNTAQFDPLPFSEKLLTMETIFKKARAYANVHGNLYILVMPDYLLRGGDAETYGLAEFQQYEEIVRKFQGSCDPYMLIVAGTMVWEDAIGLHITALVAGKNFWHRYDKQEPTQTERDQGFVAGTQSPRFEWNKLQCGIEICQDHEKGVTASNCRQDLDVHILLSMGQSRRARRMALKPSGGIFIQSELESAEHYDSLGKGETPSSGVDSFRIERRQRPGFKQVITATQTEQVTPRLTPQETTDFLIYNVVTGDSEVQLDSSFYGIETNSPPEMSIVPAEMSGAPSRLKEPDPNIPPSPSPSLLVPSPAPAPAWQLDETAALCSACHVRFGLFTRRHHCRACGKIFCDSCSRGRQQLANPAVKPGERAETGMVRVCNGCHQRAE